MMDEKEDRLDAFLRDAAQDYNQPPEAPRAEMWERIQAARRQAGVTPIRRAPRWQMPLALAAILVLGIAIGRITSTGAPVQPAAVPSNPGLAAVPGTTQPSVASRLATQDHLGQVESFLTEFDTQRNGTDFTVEARDLLGTTRLLLDSKRVKDAATRQLLEDLELVLVQIATLDPKDETEDLRFISEGLSQSHLRTRLRNAIPAGPAIRM